MRLKIETASPGSTVVAGLTALVVGLPFDRSADDLGVPAVVAERLMAESRRVNFKAELGETVYAQGEGEQAWFALIGSGVSPRATSYRRVGSAVVKLARTLRVQSAVVRGTFIADRARYLAEGLALTGYAFDRYKNRTESERARLLSVVTIAGDETLAPAVKVGLETAESVCTARDLANEHPGRCTPEFLAEQARELAAKYGFEATIRDEHQLIAEGFNLIMAVGQGSAQKPRLIHLTYRPAGAVKQRIVLVGKGVTYDSGGYSMKPAANQVNMHLDMGGAAAVLGAADAVGRLKPAGVEVHFIVPTVENLVSSNAFKLNEIVKGYNGATVEILNTDAEGRLILADALAYATKLEPDAIIDLATLTGACVVALGEETAGVFSNDNTLVSSFLDAAAAADESMWRMPLTERLDGALKSDFADMKNIGGKTAGAITAALFLKRFVGDTPWIHIDIAGPAMTEAEWEYINKGGTGFGVASLSEFVTRAGA
jgi:leucyl aminopeptidase